MKKSLTLAIAPFILMICALSCKNDFIYLNDNHFELKHQKYFPLMLNYAICFRNIDNQTVASANRDYEEIGVFETHTKKEIEEQLRGHFQLTRELGFNSIRLCFDRVSEENGRYYYGIDDTKYFIDTDYEKILNALQTVIDIAKEKDLRVMLLIRAPFEKDLKEFTVHILDKFKDNPTIFAYDFFNEPLYFDKAPKRGKTEACKIVWEWKALIKKHAPHQLFTIGFSEPIETFEWDPAMLPVDFIAFHTYHPLRVKNEAYWYSTYTQKPWMIGETSFPADNQMVSYEDQAIFLRDYYKYVVDCGGAGFGWWSFQDVCGENYEASYSGILNHTGTTTTKDGKYNILGTLKPAVKEIPALLKYTPNKKERPINYFNMLGYNNYVIKGIILNKKTKEPIEGAVIRGWNEWWSVGMNTFTNEKGEFTLYSNDKNVHFSISAPNMELISFEKTLKYKQVVSGTFDKKNLPEQQLEYQNIHYKPYLKDSAHSVFDFDTNKFNQAKFVGEMKTLYLSPVKVCK